MYAHVSAGPLICTLETPEDTAQHFCLVYAWGRNAYAQTHAFVIRTSNNASFVGSLIMISVLHMLGTETHMCGLAPCDLVTTAAI